LVGYGLEDPGSGQGLRPCALRQDWPILTTSMTYSNDERRCLWEGGKGLNVSAFMLPQMAGRKGFSQGAQLGGCTRFHQLHGRYFRPQHEYTHLSQWCLLAVCEALCSHFV
jgi:hypothetical protein